MAGPRIDEILTDSRKFSYQTDGQGSVLSLTDSLGAKSNTYSYAAYGSTKAQTGSAVNTWLYTGRQYDSESGLYFNRNRYYSPSLGKFITKDPIGIYGGINLYGYTQNNPVNYTDPRGFRPGDQYSSEDSAGGSAIGDINPTSVQEGREYAGYIYQNDNGTYSYTEPNPGSKAGSSPGPKHDSGQTVGTYHAHGANDPGYDNENFSPADINYGDRTGLDMYLGTPNGATKSYSPKTGETKNLTSK